MAKSSNPLFKKPRKKVSYEERAEIHAAFENYITDHDDPRLSGFLANDPVALKYWVTPEDMEDWTEMELLLRRAHIKQEDYLNQKGMNGQATAMSIFRLKQPWHGYRDRFEQDISSGGEKITFINSVPRPEVEKKPHFKKQRLQQRNK